MNNATYLRMIESANGGWALLSSCVFLMFSAYIAHEVARAGWSRNRLRAAIGIFVYFLGSASHHAAVWAQIRWGLMSPLVYALVITASAAVAGLSAVCILRVFSPEAWGEYGWIVPGATAVVAVSAIAMGWV